MSNYNSTLQSNNIDLQAILDTINELPEAGTGEQAAPVISVNSNGLITATAGTKSSTHQLAFQAAKTITPSTASQIAVSSGYYTGGNITVAAVPTQTKSVTPKSTSQDITPDSGKFLSKVVVAGDSNLVAGNIKSGVSIFGVSGTLESGGGSSGDAATWSENEDAMVTSTLSNYFNDRVTTIGVFAFYYCPNLTTASFPICTSIGNYAFFSCPKLTSVSFPICTSIGNDAFFSCSRLTTASFPACTTIGSNAFKNCSSLTTASFPVCTSIGSSAFYSCRNLTTINFPVCTSIGNSAFFSCPKLTSVSFPACETIGSSAFSCCSSLTTASFPVCTSIGNVAFAYCSSLTTANFPACTSIGNSAFSGCINLTTASFPVCTSIGSNAFGKCYNLKSLYLTGSALCTLSNSNAFSSTPIGGYSASAGTYGSIYVPASLLTPYQTATNWTYFSSRFVGV